MRLVVLESPYKGDGSRSVAENVIYARACLVDSLYRGEAPIASHLLHTQVLDDTVPEQRTMGIQAGLAWADRAELAVFYMDHGESAGMRAAREFYAAKGIPTEDRRILAPVKERCRHCHGAGAVSGAGPCGVCRGERVVMPENQCGGRCCS